MYYWSFRLGQIISQRGFNNSKRITRWSFLSQDKRPHHQDQFNLKWNVVLVLLSQSNMYYLMSGTNKAYPHSECFLPITQEMWKFSSRSKKLFESFGRTCDRKVCENINYASTRVHRAVKTGNGLNKKKINKK